MTGTSGTLPHGWAWARVEDTGSYINGFAFKPEHWESSGRPIIRIQNLTDPTKEFNRTTFGAPEAVRVEPGEILVSWSATLDAFIWKGEPALLNQHIFRVIPEKGLVTPGFLFYLLKESIWEMTKSEHLHGSTMRHINRGPFMAFDVPIPPKKEQARIVDEIEKQFTRLDAAVAALKHIQANLKRYRASVLKTASEGRLVPTEAELARCEGRSYEPASELLKRVLAERRARWEADHRVKLGASGQLPKEDKLKQKYKEPEGPDTSGLPTVPHGWAYVSAQQCASTITDGEHVTPQRSDSGVLLLSARNVLDGKLSLEEVDYIPEDVFEKLTRRLTIEPGDVLLSCSGSVGRSSVAPEGMRFALVRSVAVLKPLCGMGRYLSLALRSSYLQAQIKEKQTQTAQSNIFQGKIRTLVFAIPPLSEQERIVAEVERRFSVVEELEIQVEANLKRADRLRQAILKCAFQGELVPQDPNDEPASVLLGQTRAERETRAVTISEVKRPRRSKAPKVVRVMEG